MKGFSVSDINSIWNFVQNPTCLINDKITILSRKVEMPISYVLTNQFYEVGGC